MSEINEEDEEFTDKSVIKESDINIPDIHLKNMTEAKESSDIKAPTNILKKRMVSISNTE